MTRNKDIKLTKKINAGDIYWAVGKDSDIAHPHVVIGSDGHQVSLSALTTNLKRVSMPGNLLLEIGEGNLPKQSIVEVSKISTIDISQLGKYIGSLSKQRVIEIASGIAFVRKLMDRH